ncbi:MAG: BamA/TamA family outer membrane protein, partial [Planctomycetota bacterium]
EQRFGGRIFRQESGLWHHWQVGISVDAALPFSGTDEVPIFERYFLGGRNMRGFEFREVGPRSNGRPSGGDFLLLVPIQYVVPIAYEEDTGFGLDLVFFLDQGGLADDAGDFGGDDWRASAGFGIAISFGGPTQPPLEIDFGFPLRDRAGDRKQVISLTFQRNF